MVHFGEHCSTGLGWQQNQKERGRKTSFVKKLRYFIREALKMEREKLFEKSFPH
jgi:hypothetical protein